MTTVTERVNFTTKRYQSANPLNFTTKRYQSATKEQIPSTLPQSATKATHVQEAVDVGVQVGVLSPEVLGGLAEGLQLAPETLALVLGSQLLFHNRFDLQY